MLMPARMFACCRVPSSLLKAVRAGQALAGSSPDGQCLTEQHSEHPAGGLTRAPRWLQRVEVREVDARPATWLASSGALCRGGNYFPQSLVDAWRPWEASFTTACKEGDCMCAAIWRAQHGLGVRRQSTHLLSGLHVTLQCAKWQIR